MSSSWLRKTKCGTGTDCWHRFRGYESEEIESEGTVVRLVQLRRRGHTGHSVANIAEGHFGCTVNGALRHCLTS